MSLTHFHVVPAPIGHGKYDGVVVADGGGGSSILVYAPMNSDHIALLDSDSRTFSNVSLPFSGHHKYSGAAAVGGSVYFAPHSADTVGILDVVTRQFSTVPIFNGQQYKYAGAAYSAASGKLYFGPYNERNVGVFEPAGALFSTIPLPAAALPGGRHDGAHYSGAVSSRSGEIVCFTPYNSNVVLLLNTRDDSFTTVPLTGHAVLGDARFVGGAVVEDAGGAGSGSFVYLAPYNTNAIGVVDVERATFASIAIPFRGFAKYAGAATLNDKVFFAPCTRKSHHLATTTNCAERRVSARTDAQTIRTMWAC